MLTTLPPFCAVVMKSVNFNFVEPSGPLQACNGTALPLPLPLHVPGFSRPIIRRYNCIYVTLGTCYSVQLTVWYAGLFHPAYQESNLHRITSTKVHIYRVSQEECVRLREGVPYVKVYRYNPKHLCPKLNSYGDNGQRKVCGLLAGPRTVPSADDLIHTCP